MNEQNKEFCYSLDGESYHGKYGSRESALFHGKISADKEDFEWEEVTIYVGECRNPLDILDNEYRITRIGESIFEDSECTCNDEIGAEESTLDMSRDKQKELGRIVLDFMKANADQTYYGVVNVVEHGYIVGTEDLRSDIATYVRHRLLVWWIQGRDKTTSEYSFRAGTVLTPEAQAERDEFYTEYSGRDDCTCFLSPPCGCCVHPGNPRNQEESDECWEPVLKGVPA